MNNCKSAFTVCLLLFAALRPAGNAQTSPGTNGTGAADYLTGLNTAYIDKSVDPCQDFYQFACGKFSAIHPIPADRSSFGNFELLFDENEKILHAILEKAAAGGPGRTANEQKIGDYYASCLDSAAINAAGLKPLKPEFDRIDNLKSKDELSDLLAHFQLIGVNAFMAFGEQQDFKDARKQIAAADQGGLGLPERDYYLRTGDADEKLRKQYVQHVTNMFKLLGKPEAEAAADAQKVMDLETALAKVSLDVTSQREPKNVYHMTPVANLQKLTPEIDWTRFLAAIGAPPVTELNVTHPPFFTGLNAVLESTDLDTIKIYLTWQLVNSTPSTTLPQAFDEEQFSFNGKILSGQPERRPRWKRCVQSTDGALGEALGQVYAAQAFRCQTKEHRHACEAKRFLYAGTAVLPRLRAELVRLYPA